MSVRRAGDYSQHQCGLSFTAAAHHSGVWVCELERYHSGFSRRYGELRYGQVTVSVSRDLEGWESTTVRTTNMTTSTSTSTTSTTSRPTTASTRGEAEHSYLELKFACSRHHHEARRADILQLPAELSSHRVPGQGEVEREAGGGPVVQHQL